MVRDARLARPDMRLSLPRWLGRLLKRARPQPVVVPYRLIRRPSLCSVAHEAEQNRAEARQWARQLLDRKDWLIVDTETTGLDGRAEIVQIAIVAPTGEAVLNTLVRPQGPIPSDATAIHGIRLEDTVGRPTYGELGGSITQLLRGRTVVSYNADYDRRLVQQTAARYGLREPDAFWECAMLQYARYVGDWNGYRNDFKWQKLPAAQGSQAHSAVGDCQSTLAVIWEMAQN
jgi:DNA polymerase-3 subunit epsilon